MIIVGALSDMTLILLLKEILLLILLLIPLTIGGTVLKESDDLVILGVTFDSKITFEKHLGSVSRAASHRLVILRKSWRVFHDRSLLGRCFRRFALPVLEYCVDIDNTKIPISTEQSL